MIRSTNTHHNKISNLKRLIGGHRNQLLFLIFCISLSMVFNLGPRLLSISYGNLDPSFNYGVNRAAMDGASFGDEFIATYGPLGFLTSNYMPSNLTEVMIWDSIHVLLLGLGVFLLVRPRTTDNAIKRYVWASVIIFIFSISSNGGMVEWNYLAIYCLYCLLLITTNKKNKIYYALGLIMFACIFLFIKFTLGFAAISSLIILLLTGIKQSRLQRLKNASIAVLIYLALITFMSNYLNINNLTQYIRSAMTLSSEFSSAMASVYPGTEPASFILLASIALFFAWLVLSLRKESIRHLYLLPVFFVVWKYCVVRQDSHILAIVFILFPIGFMYLYTFWNINRKYNFVFVTSLLLSVLALWANNIPYFGNGGFNQLATSPLTNLTSKQPLHFFNRSSQIKNWHAQSTHRTLSAKLPPKFTEEISGSCVDVFPWEIAVVYANDLDWCGRPSPFSFETYNESLDSSNATFFKSNEAPRFIIWHKNEGVYGVDNRHILWDEPNSLKVIMENYIISQSNEDFMLLKRIDNPAGNIKSRTISLGSVEKNGDWLNIDVSKEERIFLDFRIEPSLSEKIKTVFLRDNPHYLEVAFSNGEIKRYRFVRENSAQGFIIGPLPNDWNEMVELFRGNIKSTNQVYKIRLN